MSKKLLLFVCMFLMFKSLEASSFEVCFDSVGVTTLNGKKHILYLVSPGETIYRISTQYQVAVSELMETNPELENGLKTGQIIQIPYYPDLLATYRKKVAGTLPAQSQNVTAPTTSGTGEPGDTVIHIVQPGETLYGLSRKYGVSIEELKMANNWDLKAGQELVIPKPKENISQAERPGAKENEKTVTGRIQNPAVPSLAAGEPGRKAPETGKTQEPDKKAEPEKKTVVVKSDPVVTRQDSLRMVQQKAPQPPAQAPLFDPNDNTKRVMVIPFDPYLYFSDADDEIAARSKIPRQKVRQMFRRRLNVLIAPRGYETIHLLGGTSRDSLMDINRIYSSVTYNYQDILYSEASLQKGGPNGIELGSPPEKTWVEKQKEKMVSVQNASKPKLPKDHGRYFGVKINDPEFFPYFNGKYGITYYVFINQFEVKTNYEHCLDRAAQDYERNFVAHFSIFDNTGKQIAGNKVKIFYNSNSNSIFQIVNDNMQKMADAILAELPPR
jgi:LysM repeat protein